MATEYVIVQYICNVFALRKLRNLTQAKILTKFAALMISFFSFNVKSVRFRF